MASHLQREIDKLKKQALSLCSAVEGQVEKALRAVIDRDDELAQEVERIDIEIDQREIEVEEECLKTLALYQPVAGDLRMIVATLKINHDMERIGDMAVNIARKARGLILEPPPDLNFDLSAMWRKTQSVLHDSIDSLVNMDVKMAASVCARDDEIDYLKQAMRKEVEATIRKKPDKVGSLLRLLAVTRNLERIADLATNIGEDVIYLVEGRIARHGSKLHADKDIDV